MNSKENLEIAWHEKEISSIYYIHDNIHSITSKAYSSNLPVYSEVF